LYLKIFLVSYEGELLYKVVWYRKDRKERITVLSAIQASEVALLLCWWLYSLCTVEDTALLTKIIVKMIRRPVSLH
jgi:hypothetical protein